MAEQKKSSFWTSGQLKKRGWTPDLIRSLLPKPQYRFLGSRRMPTWPKESVLLAEADPGFRKQVPLQAQNVSQTRDKHLNRSRQLLQDAWSRVSAPDSPEGILAGYYHQAVLQHLPAAAELNIPPRRIPDYLQQLYSMQTGSSEKLIPAALTRFALAASHFYQVPESSFREKLRKNYGPSLLRCAEKAIQTFTEAQPEADLSALLGMEDFPFRQLLSHPLGYLYSVVYIPLAIRSSLNLLVALNPKDEYPAARAMARHFILHIGGTNTGKTYAGFQRLKQAATGVYLAPLRLLALEAQEILLDAGVNCSLTTGEEEDCREHDTHVSATAEKLSLAAEYEVAVIDECQMIADRQRGYAWTRAILGVLAPEIHLCAAPEAKDLLIRLIESCGDSWELETHQRKTPLICMNHTIDYTQVQPGDALITFSKVGVLSVAEDLRQAGKSPAIIYGALPYSTRRMQMEGFLSGRMKYIVSTDAIGMGLNLPIRRIIFMESRKFDGTERRDLKPEEIQQIAGRAGRFGIYDKGYVGATENLSAIRIGLGTIVPPLQYAIAGFSDLVLKVDFDLLDVLTEWNRIPTPEPYQKLDISRYITLITKIREKGFSLTREQELRAANIPFDETEEELRDLFFRFLRLFFQDSPIHCPELPEGTSRTLPELELYCRKLDLYFSFCKAFSCPVDLEDLYDRREDIAEQINEILLTNLKNNIRFCSSCGRALPLHHSGRLCDACYRRRRPGRF